MWLLLLLSLFVGVHGVNFNLGSRSFNGLFAKTGALPNDILLLVRPDLRIESVVADVTESSIHVLATWLTDVTLYNPNVSIAVDTFAGT